MAKRLCHDWRAHPFFCSTSLSKRLPIDIIEDPSNSSRFCLLLPGCIRVDDDG
ncbi:hypothetical protein YC2023_099192 [Brassica napus]